MCTTAWPSIVTRRTVISVGWLMHQHSSGSRGAGSGSRGLGAVVRRFFAGDGCGAALGARAVRRVGAAAFGSLIRAAPPGVTVRRSLARSALFSSPSRNEQCGCASGA